MTTKGAQEPPAQKELVLALEVPRIIWIMSAFRCRFRDQRALRLMSPGDVVISLGTPIIRIHDSRYNQLKGWISLPNVGTSGGTKGARFGACYMVGGDSGSLATGRASI